MKPISPLSGLQKTGNEIFSEAILCKIGAEVKFLSIKSVRGLYLPLTLFKILIFDSPKNPPKSIAGFVAVK